MYWEIYRYIGNDYVMLPNHFTSFKKVGSHHQGRACPLGVRGSGLATGTLSNGCKRWIGWVIVPVVPVVPVVKGEFGCGCAFGIGTLPNGTTGWTRWIGCVIVPVAPLVLIVNGEFGCAFGIGSRGIPWWPCGCWIPCVLFCPPQNAEFEF